VATTQITISALWGTKGRGGRVLRAGKRERTKISKRKRWAGRLSGGAAKRAKARAAYTAHLRKLRQGGELLDTWPALVELGLRRLLVARGWDHDWPPVDDEALLQGRWTGSREIGAPERINVRVDEDLVERVRAACWHTSVEAIAELRDWRDEHPGLVFGDELDEYNELAERVVTPGEAWREALEHVLPMPKRPPETTDPLVLAGKALVVAELRRRMSEA
jgi:hypothetical protein